MSFVRILALGGLLAAGAMAATAVWFRTPLLAIGDAVVSLFEEPDWADVETPERLMAFIQAHPDQVSYLVATVGKDGALVDGSVLSHGADTPRVLASTMKIVVLSALARAIDNGEITADEPVELGEWDSWYLADTDGGAHPAAYDRLGVPHHKGAATDPAATVPLIAVADAMIRFSDNAGTDLLLARLGDRVEAELVLLRADGGVHDPIHPILEGWIELYTGQTPDLSSREKRDEVRASARPSVGLSDQRAWMAANMPRSTTATYARLMARVGTRTHISVAASDFMIDRLSWPMDGPLGASYEQIGTKGGSVAGVLTEATFSVAKKGDHAGETRVMALFFGDLSHSAWLSMQAGYPHQDLMFRVMGADAEADALAATLSR